MHISFLMNARLLFLCLLFPLSCMAAKPYTPRRMDPVLEPWRWREMSELSGPGALCVDEAIDGTLWFGAVGGVFQYDGLQVNWIPFDRAFGMDDGAVFSRIPWCTSLVCLPDGRLLAVVDSALFFLEDGAWKMVL